MLLKCRCDGPIDGTQTAIEVLRKWLRSRRLVDRDKEHFWTIGLDTQLYPKYFELVSLGTLDSSLVHPREVFRSAIIKAVGSLIIAHNHPSGIVEPSEVDRRMTQRLAVAGDYLGIPIRDHIIIGLQGASFSFAGSLPDDLNTTCNCFGS
jgi:DNA repair protein RadC